MNMIIYLHKKDLIVFGVLNTFIIKKGEEKIIIYKYYKNVMNHKRQRR